MKINLLKNHKGWAMGPEIEQFEKELAKYVGTKYALVFNSGTSAIHATLLALGIKGEVIVPSFTFVATVNMVEAIGAKPIFADIEEETFGLDPEDIERKITPRTKAIMPIHYAGCPCKIREIKKICDKHGLFLIEDACEGLGAKIGRKMVGSFGDVGIFSFCQNKIITTGEGGAITTNNRSVYEKLKLIRSHGKVGDDVVCVGYNFRMPTMNAKEGLGQLKQINKAIARRREIADYYGHLAQKPPKDYFHVYQLYTIFGKQPIKNIETKVYFKPAHLTTYYKKYKVKLLITEKISKQVLSIPIYPELTHREMEYISNQIWKTASSQKSIRK